MIALTFINVARTRFVRQFNYWPGRGEGDHYAVYEVVGQPTEGSEPWTVDNRRTGVFSTAHEAIRFAREGEVE